MTENYIIFVEQPFKLDIVRLATAQLRGVTWGKCLKYDQDDIVRGNHCKLYIIHYPLSHYLINFVFVDSVPCYQQKDREDSEH